MVKIKKPPTIYMLRGSKSNDEIKSSKPSPCPSTPYKMSQNLDTITDHFNNQYVQKVELLNNQVRTHHNFSETGRKPQKEIGVDFTDMK